MNLIRKRIKYLIDEIKRENKTKNKPRKKEYCVINLLFNTLEFNSKCSSVGDFMKKLKNGKLSYDNQEYYGRPKQNNREYFSEIIGEGGFYRYNYGVNFVEINIYIELKGKIQYYEDGEIIKSRIKKIVKPIEIELGFNHEELFHKTFRDLTIIDTGWNVFGKDFREKPIE